MGEIELTQVDLVNLETLRLNILVKDPAHKHCTLCGKYISGGGTS